MFNIRDYDDQVYAKNNLLNGHYPGSAHRLHIILYFLCLTERFEAHFGSKNILPLCTKIVLIVNLES